MIGIASLLCAQETVTYSEYLRRADLSVKDGNEVGKFENLRKGLRLALEEAEGGRMTLNPIADALAQFISPQSEAIVNSESSAGVFAARQSILTRASRLDFDLGTLGLAEFSEARRKIADACLSFASEVSAALDPRYIDKAEAEQKAAEDSFIALPWETKKEMWDRGEPNLSYATFKNPTLKAAVKRKILARNNRIYAESMQRAAKENWPQLAATIGGWLERLYSKAPTNTAEIDALLTQHGLQKSLVADALRK